jgi:hypothetical protein
VFQVLSGKVGLPREDLLLGLLAHLLLPLGHLEGGLGAALPGLEVLPHLSGHPAGLDGVLGALAAAVQVAGKDDVAQAGQMLGPPSGVVVQPLERLPEQLVELRLAERHLVVRHSLAL